MTFDPFGDFGAKRYLRNRFADKLPEVVSDFIRQHHGTSLVTYFYHQAIITSDSPAGIPECCFHYCGPRPQTREAGILMLADTVESVVRSSLRKHPGRVDAIVARAIQGRLAEGQLKECDLTFREIDTIQAVFVRVLSAIHHHRIEYPAAAGASAERLVAGAGSGR
jgi:membrane-associated HD superfamily phosphohydrolase